MGRTLPRSVISPVMGARLGVKLGLRTRADVVDYALESGLLKPEREA